MLESCSGRGPGDPEPAPGRRRPAQARFRRRPVLHPQGEGAVQGQARAVKRELGPPRLLHQGTRDLQPATGLHGVAGVRPGGGLNSGAASTPRRGRRRPPQRARGPPASCFPTGKPAPPTAAAPRRPPPQPVRAPTSRVPTARGAAADRATASGTGKASSSAGRLASSLAPAGSPAAAQMLLRKSGDLRQAPGRPAGRPPAAGATLGTLTVPPPSHQGSPAGPAPRRTPGTSLSRRVSSSWTVASWTVQRR